LTNTFIASTSELIDDLGTKISYVITVFVLLFYLLLTHSVTIFISHNNLLLYYTRLDVNKLPLLKVDYLFYYS